MTLKFILWKMSNDTFNYGLWPEWYKLKTKYCFEPHLSYQMVVIIF